MTPKKPKQLHSKHDHSLRKVVTLIAIVVVGILWLVTHDSHMSTELAALGIGNGLLVLLEMLFEG